MRFSFISAIMLFLVHCDKSVIEPTHSNPFDDENIVTLGDPFNFQGKNYPDRIQLQWNDLIGESELQITGYILKKLSGSNLIETKDFFTGRTSWDDISNLTWGSTYTYKLSAKYQLSETTFIYSEEYTIEITRKISVGTDILDTNIDYYTITDILEDINQFYSFNPDSMDAIISVYVEGGNYFENIQINTPVELICEDGQICIIDGNSQQVISIEEVGELGSFSGSLDTSKILIDGFTIKNGGGVLEGGGIKINKASPKFINCDIINNTAESGGGVYIEGASPIFSYCNFLNNSAQGKGGAGYIINSDAKFIACEFTGNKAFSLSPVADNDGGALYILFSEVDDDILISNCIFNGNQADLGPAIYMHDQSANNQSSIISIQNYI